MENNHLFEIDPWLVKSCHLNKKNKRFQESITSIGNGYMGMRGIFEESYSGDTMPGIYIAGVWYPDKTRVGWWKNGYPEYFGKVINAINFIKLRLFIDQEEIDLFTDKIEAFSSELDMEKGYLKRSFIVEKGSKKVRFTFERFVSLAQKELCAINIHAENLGPDAMLFIQSAIDSDVKNEDANYEETFWHILEKDQADDEASLIARTKENKFGIPQFSVGCQMNHKAAGWETVSYQDASDKQVINSFQINLKHGAETDFEKRIVVVTSRDYNTLAELKEAMAQLAETVNQENYNQLFHAHAELWRNRWRLADVEIDGDPKAQQGIRFNLFQLFSTYYGEDSRLNIGPKGFTGEKYGGATYWDTEAFAIPLFLALADPKVAKNLLLYRYQQLDGAIHNAKQQGLNGALFPMVTFTGVECHNEWEITFEEIHRNGSMAYAIYNYTNYTGDETYVLTKGIKVLIEISRFWADRVHYSNHKKCYMIHGVTGPNEYENNVNNNWYTNLMAQWTLRYTLQILKRVDQETIKDLHVTAEEQNKWQEISDHMYLPEDDELGIFVQHDTFLDKDLLPVSYLPKEVLPINQHWSWDKILRSPYIKQADVLQGIYYFIDQFTPEQKRKNFDFYEPLTVHESSLSPCIHSILAADLQKEEKAVEMYERTARLDLDNYNHDTQDGLHITSMTGSWLAIVHGFAGMRILDGQLSFQPFLPKAWKGYRFRINFRGRLLSVDVTQFGTTVKLISGESLKIQLNGQSLTLKKNSGGVEV